MLAPIIIETNHKDEIDRIFRGIAAGPAMTTAVIQKLRGDIEIRLEQAQLAADAANKEKSAILAHMIHEIRSPIGVMIGFAEMLRDPSLNDPDKSTYAETIYRNGQSVLAIINDLLDLSKVEANKLELDLVEFNFINLLHETADSMQIKAREKGLELRVIVGERVPAIIKADPGSRRILVPS